MLPIAALVWAALTYKLFTVSLINCVICMVMHYTISGHYLAESTEAYFSTTMSIRVRLFMLAIGPLLTLSIISLNNQKIYDQISYFANFDSLTSAMNRRYFYQEGEQILNSSEENTTNKSASILVIDLDHFKSINDTYGHAVGDQVLEQFTQNIKAQINEGDLFGRVGGEEFAILLKDLTLKQSVDIAKIICEKTSETPILLSDHQELKISVSIGVSHQMLPFHGNIQQLINRADSALYQAKQSGRNRMCVEPHL